MTYEDAIFDWMDDIPEFNDSFYAGFEDGTKIIEWLDKHEDFRIPIADMAGDEIGAILDRFNKRIEEAKEVDEPTIFLGTEIPQKEIDKQEEIDLTPESDPFTVKFEEPTVNKQILLLQEEIKLAREELEELEEEEREEKEEEFEEEIEEELIKEIVKEEEPSTIESIKSIGSSIRKFLGF